MTEIKFLYDFGSPKAYFVHKLLPKVAEKHHAKILWMPILLGGVFKLTNNQSPIEAFKGVKGKLSYDGHETDRFVKRHKLPFKPNPHFPVMTIGVMRGAIYAQDKDFASLYTDTIFTAMWEDEKKMDSPDVIAEVLHKAGLPAREIMEAMQKPDVKAQLIEATNNAVSRNVFGTPTMFIGQEMFFGKEGISEIDFYLFDN